MYNEIFPPIIEKQMILESNERLLFQLLEQYSVTDKGTPKPYKLPKKSHSKMLEKKFIPLYLEDLKFLIQRNQLDSYKDILHI